MKMALERQGVPADEVGMINPHGTSTPVGDKCESEAIWTAFGSHTPNVLISATKSMTGHMMGAAGAFEGVATVLSVYHQTVPGTLNYVEPDPNATSMWPRRLSRSPCATPFRTTSAWAATTRRSSSSTTRATEPTGATAPFGRIRRPGLECVPARRRLYSSDA